MSVGQAAADIRARLEEVERLTDLSSDRLDTKIDLSGAGVHQRLDEAFALLEFCERLHEASD